MGAGINTVIEFFLESQVKSLRLLNIVKISYSLSQYYELNYWRLQLSTK